MWFGFSFNPRFFVSTWVKLIDVRNVHKIKVGFRYEFWLIHRQILGTITHIEPKI